MGVRPAQYRAELRLSGRDRERARDQRPGRAAAAGERQRIARSPWRGPQPDGRGPDHPADPRRAEGRAGPGGLHLVDRAAGARAAGARPGSVRQRPDGRASGRPHAQPQLRADLLMRIGILTGGGDVPGLNACIRSVVLSADALGWEVIGFRRGWEGVMRIDPDDPASVAAHSLALTREGVRGIDRTGGTILHTSRRDPRTEAGGDRTRDVLNTLEKL